MIRLFNMKLYRFNLKLYDQTVANIYLQFVNWFLACDLAKEQKRNFGDDIASTLRVARKKRFAVQEEKRICQEIQLQTYLNRYEYELVYFYGILPNGIINEPMFAG